MRKEMFEALKESLKIWIDRANGNLQIGKSCPLCKAVKFNDQNRDNGCGDCPLNVFSNGRGCKDVPYKAPYTVENNLKVVKILASLLPDSIEQVKDPNFFHWTPTKEDVDKAFRDGKREGNNEFEYNVKKLFESGVKHGRKEIEYKKALSFEDGKKAGKRQLAREYSEYWLNYRAFVASKEFGKKAFEYGKKEIDLDISIIINNLKNEVKAAEAKGKKEIYYELQELVHNLAKKIF